MARTRKYYFKNNYLTLRSKVKVPQRSMVRDTPPYGHAPTYQISLTYFERQKCYGPDKKILFKNNYLTLRSKSNEGHYGMRHTTLWSCTHIPNIIDLSRKKQLFDLEVKGQGPIKVITVRNTPPYGHAPTYQISLTHLERQKCYGPDKKILFKK